MQGAVLRYWERYPHQGVLVLGTYKLKCLTTAL